MYEYTNNNKQSTLLFFFCHIFHGANYKLKKEELSSPGANFFNKSRSRYEKALSARESKLVTKVFASVETGKKETSCKCTIYIKIECSVYFIYNK